MPFDLMCWPRFTSSYCRESMIREALAPKMGGDPNEPLRGAKFSSDGAY